MMEKASSTPNRRTRSSARNTPSRKSEDSLESNPAEELKHNLRKARRKAETKPNTNGNSANDVDTKKLQSCEELSEGNSLEGCDSEDSNVSSSVQKSNSRANKTVSPTISRRSLRTRRSVTPGPESEPNVSRKLRRSTSVESVLTPSKRRHVRAKSESNDFVFSPSKMNSDYENSFSESNSKCIPINFALRVIDETTEEDNEIESHHNRISTSIATEVEVRTDEHDVVKHNKKSDICQNKIIRTDSPSVTVAEDESDEEVVVTFNKTRDHSVSPVEEKIEATLTSQEQEADSVKEVGDQCPTLQPDSNEYANPVTEINDHLSVSEEVEDGQKPVSILTVTDSDLVTSVDSDSLTKSNHQLAAIKEVDATQERNEKVDIIKESCDDSAIPTSTDTTKKSSDQLKIIEGADVAKESSFQLSISEEVTSHELCEETKTSELQNIEKINIVEEIGECHAEPSVNVESLNNGVLLKDKQSDAENNEVNDESEIKCIEIENMDSEKELSRARSINKVSNTADVNRSLDSSQLDSAITGPENVSVTENNNVSLMLEVESENEDSNTPNQNLATSKSVFSGSLSSSPEKSLIVSDTDTKSFHDDKTETIDEADESVVICGSDSGGSCENVEIGQDDIEHVDESEMNCDQMSSTTCDDHKENVEGVDCEELTKVGVSTINQRIVEKGKENHIKSNKTNIEQHSSHVPEIAAEDKYKNELNIGEDNYCKDNSGTDENKSSQGENTEIVELTLQNSQELVPTALHRSLSEEFIDGAKQLVEFLDQEKIEKNKQKASKISRKDNFVDDSSKQNHSKLKENNVLDVFEDKNSESGSELYKNMSDFGSDVDEKKEGSQYGDFGSDVDEKKEGSQYGDSVSSELRTGDSEEYVSSFDGEEDDEEDNNDENQPSDEQEQLENFQKSIKSKVAENVFDNNSPMTYDKALAMINKNRVKKIDDEEFFDMFTQELNKVSEESGSDSDIAIVDEYIAEPEEKQQSKSKQQPANSQTNIKNPQRLAPPNSIPNRPMPPTSAAYTQQIQMPIQRVNLKLSQKSNSSHNPLPNNFSEAYNQQAQNDHNHPSMARMTYSQGGLYHQYNQGVPPMDSGSYDQYAPPPSNMEDPRMFHPHHGVPDNFSRGAMFGHPLGPMSDTQMHYSGGPTVKVRNIDTMCGSHPSNAVNLNPEHQIRNLNENDPNYTMGVSAATMTESSDKLEQSGSYSFSSKKTGSITNPILEILGLDKKKLKMLKKVLGLDESREKQRIRIKQILIEEAQKMGLKMKSTKEIRKKILRNHENALALEYATQMKERKKLLNKLNIDSDSDTSSSSVQSHSIHSSEEPVIRNEETSSLSQKDESSSENSNKNEAGLRRINFEDGGVSVTIDTRPKRKQRHRDPKRTIPYVPTPITKANERKRNYQSSESSDEGHLKEKKKMKLRQNKKMTQGKKQNKKQSKVLQSNCGTFTVDPITSTSQSDSETTQDESNKYREELIKSMREELELGKNKLSNMFTQRSFKEERKSLKRKADEMEPLVFKATKSKRLPAELLAKLGNEENEAKRQKKDQPFDLESEALPERSQRKGRQRAPNKKLRLSSTAAEKEYIPLIVSGPTQFGLQRLDKDGTSSSVEKAAKFRSDRLYGSAVKRITSEELLNVKKKQKRNKLTEMKKGTKKAP